MDRTRRALVWGVALPLLALLGAFATPWALLLFLAYPAQIIRLASRDGWLQGLFLTMGKFAEAQGALSYLWRRLIGAQARLIEYK